MTTTGPTGESGSTGDAVRALTDDVRRLVREELGSAQRELIDKARRAKAAGILLGGAGLFAGLALGTGATVLTRTLDRVLPPATSALVTSAVYGAAAAALASAGISELNRILPVVSAETVDSVRDQVRAATAAGARAGERPPGAANNPAGSSDVRSIS